MRYRADRAAVVVYDADTEEASGHVVAVDVRVPDVIDRAVCSALIAGISSDSFNRVFSIHNVRITLRSRAQNVHGAVPDLRLKGCQHVNFERTLPAAEYPAPAADEVVSVKVGDVTVDILHRIFDMTEAVSEAVGRYDQRRSEQICDVLDLDRKTEVSGHLRHYLGAVQPLRRLVKVN